MTALRWLGVPLAVGIAAAAFTSCKSTTGSGTTGTGGAGGEASSGTGISGTGGSADSGPADADAAVEAGPIVCLATSTNIPKGPCNLIDQDCPPGKSCRPTQEGSVITTSCVDTPGLKSAGEDCYADAECDAKLMCIGQTATHPGQCVAFCCNDSSNAPCNGGLCNEQVTFGNGLYAYMCSYGQRCELLTADACPAGFDCHVESGAGQGVAVCLEPSPSEVGELMACNFINDCPSMLDCFGLNGSTAGVCAWYCALSGPTTSAAPGLGGCPKGETCESMYQGQPINTDVSGIGLCIPSGGLVPIDAGSKGDGG